MALKSAETWGVSRHANDLPSYARIMAFYSGERVEAASSRATSEKGSAKEGVDLRVGAPTSASEGSKSDSEAQIAVEIVIVETFVRRLDAIIEALQAQMAPYNSTMPCTYLVSSWREIGDRIAARGPLERRREDTSRNSVSLSTASRVLQTISPATGLTH
ncbi:hypothetical protein CC85DRAFT_71319 [Cutaneotrichosporon oleaginosum]|uniref:Uncharacterized protein n=1 Tax=Cutaneotrichosporon oleaginosum TaxID=879819 RepID=A0A0J0XPK5_9TREE|nr:uncharacterized protein CC85DRAFT_71319 [Cutaneotrichosporon oleaginosum]KLT43050.1 hypothetical protein CC85DRAFT_71319 [Cutaneotrichosporon oleaginosum]TXT11749.1 hypothetical protein COLE_02159 [Cutaneotrichosporon oleaginosum]